MARSVKIQWMGEERLSEMEAAAERGIAAAADTLRSEIIRTLSKTTGQAVGKTRTGRNIYSASQPGTPPGSRSGRLRNSIATRRVRRLTWGVGSNLKYARIHELGGTINHPGGTPYLMIGGNFTPISKSKADELRQRGFWVGRTRPYPIGMPKRPYLVPTLQRLSGSGKLQKVFTATFRKSMGVAP